jgi:hypothetical protein
MIRDVYLFTNGTILAFDEAGQQREEMQGPLTEDLKKLIMREMTTNARITFARWKRSFFELTRDEFDAAYITGTVDAPELRLVFDIKKETDEAPKANSSN